MTRASLREYAARQRERYAQATTRPQKRAILNEVVAVAQPAATAGTGENIEIEHAVHQRRPGPGVRGDRGAGTGLELEGGAVRGRATVADDLRAMVVYRRMAQEPTAALAPAPDGAREQNQAALPDLGGSTEVARGGRRATAPSGREVRGRGRRK